MCSCPKDPSASMFLMGPGYSWFVLFIFLCVRCPVVFDICCLSFCYHFPSPKAIPRYMYFCFSDKILNILNMTPFYRK